MSRNNLIIVVCWRGRYYVIPDADADGDWTPSALKAWILEKNMRASRSRGRALVHAHNLQRTLQTEYGVRECVVRSRHPDDA